MHLGGNCNFSLYHQLSGFFKYMWTLTLLTILSILREEQGSGVVIRRPGLWPSVFPAVYEVGGSGDVNVQAVV